MSLVFAVMLSGCAVRAPWEPKNTTPAEYVQDLFKNSEFIEFEDYQSVNIIRCKSTSINKDCLKEWAKILYNRDDIVYAFMFFTDKDEKEGIYYENGTICEDVRIDMMDGYYVPDIPEDSNVWVYDGTELINFAEYLEETQPIGYDLEEDEEMPHPEAVEENQEEDFDLEDTPVGDEESFEDSDDNSAE